MKRPRNNMKGPLLELTKNGESDDEGTREVLTTSRVTFIVKTALVSKEEIGIKNLTTRREDVTRPDEDVEIYIIGDFEERVKTYIDL